MDLRNNKIAFGEVLMNPKAEGIFRRCFPEIMNPFLLQKAEKIELGNILKLASGPNAQETVDSIIAKLKLI